MAEPFRLLVTGSRTWTDDEAIRWHLAGQTLLHPGLIVVHGGAGGADRIAAACCMAIGIRQEIHRADWKQHGRAAGMIRNTEMVRAGAGLCLAFIHECYSGACAGKPPHGSHGASHCADLAESYGIPVQRFGFAATAETPGEGEGRADLFLRARTETD